MPKYPTTHKVCGDDLSSFCEDYVFKSKASYWMALIASGMVIVGLLHLCLCLVSIYSKEDLKESIATMSIKVGYNDM